MTEAEKQRQRDAYTVFSWGLGCGFCAAVILLLMAGRVF